MMPIVEAHVGWAVNRFANLHPHLNLKLCGFLSLPEA